MEFWSSLDWGYFLPSLIMLGCTLFGVSGVVSTGSGWFFAHAPNDNLIHLGTLSASMLRLPPEFASAGTAALVLVALGCLLSALSFCLGFVMSAASLSKRTFWTGTSAWVSAGCAGLAYV